jgi:hypothetical protein
MTKSFFWIFWSCLIFFISTSLRSESDYDSQGGEIGQARFHDYHGFDNKLNFEFPKHWHLIEKKPLVILANSHPSNIWDKSEIMSFNFINKNIPTYEFLEHTLNSAGIGFWQNTEISHHRAFFLNSINETIYIILIRLAKF